MSGTRDANPWEYSDECRGRSDCHQRCNGYAGGYDTWICACRCHTPGSGP